ncbi:MAG: aminotransferase class I/II-fold pyridoxal phosphate-dependent enzyme [Actinomycetota bacterium]
MTGIPASGAHGGDGPSIGRALGIDVLDLSQSLNPFAPDVVGIVARHAAAVGVYPDPADATTLLAETLGVAADRLLVTNGGSEAIHLVATELGGTVASEPEFSLHPRGSGPVWRSDPHNPSGRLAPADLEAEVWDEAFYPLATGRWHGHRAGVTVGSLTKLFACPGLRLGYVIADDVERFARRQPAWSVNSLALAALPELLPAAEPTAWCAAIGEARRSLTEALTDRGLTVDAADGPWVLVHAPGLRDRLAPQGVAVRDCASFGMAGWHRIAVPDDAGRARLLDALDGIDRSA